MNITEIHAELTRIADYLKTEKGFRSANVQIKVEGNRQILSYIYCSDPFDIEPGYTFERRQEILPHTRIPAKDFDAADYILDMWSAAMSAPPRAEREIKALAKRMGDDIEELGVFETEAALMFLERVKQAREDILDKYLTDQSEATT